MNELVSIITPMYNAKKYIGKTIESVLAQKYENWEMIIVDDCSTDGCERIVEEYVKTEPRIRLIKAQHNGGVARARNIAIENAKGRYIAFLDSDDLWRKEKLYRQISYMERKNIHFCHTGCAVITESGQKTGKERGVPHKVTYRELLRGNAVNCLTVVIDREHYSKIYMPEIKHEDYACWLDLLSQSEDEAAYGINEILADYRECNTSVSGNKLKAAGWQWNIYRHYLKMGIIRSVWCFVNYSVNAVRKRI